ncbi:hypothetical protein [Mucilaginibacter jinjuensis]|uniref:Glycosyl hydrolase family 2 n=1 Tax=Mucilaginibacter jinjuensis TaxID=1176721 RepID=A0ABY7T1A3_9SPHI|nr:hypothetical protein [Mucilaginibacter jinjuensis]WCT10202.1 hypothetical protein PQO05_15815 [Mucilaginibacter jinjuensis]
MRLLSRLFAIGIAVSGICFAASAKPIKVTIVKKGDGYTLLRGGKPYFIKGAGGSSYLDKLVECGGNSIRTWNSNIGALNLKEAYQRGLTVTMGLSVGIERHGFNYDDTAAVHAQLETLRKEVRKYRDSSALLIWDIGNELNLNYKNPKVWDAVNGIAKMIHEEDPNHPATTSLAGVNPKVVAEIIARCPDLDLLAVQVYGGLAKVPQQIREAKWTKAYIVTEWGPTGHWEGPQTPWKASVEETSTEKAAVYKSRYEASIKVDKNCLGSYVFLWGQKQERTPTWYGLFTENGETSEVVDVMQYLWTGSYPKNRAPHLDSLLLENKRGTNSVYLQAGKAYQAEAFVHDPENDKLTARWELLPESTDLKTGGDHESRPEPIAGLIGDANTEHAIIKAPEKEGAYRLFLYVMDGHNHVATANIPFYVKP